MQLSILAQQQLTTQILPCSEVRAELMRKSMEFVIIKIHESREPGENLSGIVR